MKKIDKASSIMMILVLTKILGFLKVRIIAQLFGASAELDIFWAAFAIPDTLFNVLVAGAINAAIIPIFSDVLLKDGEKKLKDLFKSLNILFLILFVLFGIIVYIFARDIGNFLINSQFLHSFLGSSKSMSASDLDLFVKLMRIMLLSPLFLGVSSILTAYLHVHKRFFVSSVAPLLYNLGMIIVSWVLVSKYNFGVDGLAWGVAVGSLFHFVTQIPMVFKYMKQTNGRLKERLSRMKLVVKGKEMWKIIKLAFPRMLGLMGEYVNVFINTIISFTLNAGALSAYKFAYSLHLFPVQIFSGAFSQVALPNLAEYYAKGEKKRFKAIFNTAIQESMFMILPMVAIFLTLKLPIVRLAYGVGAFDWDATRITSTVLAILGIAVVGQGLLAIILRAFYAIRETKLLLIATAVTIIVNALGSYYFTNFFSHYYDWRPILDQVVQQLTDFNGTGLMEAISSLGGDFARWMTTRNGSQAAVYGLALSTSVSFVIEVVVASILLNRKIKVITYKDTIKPMLPKILNSLLTGISMYFIFKNVDFILDTTRTVNLVLLTGITLLYGGIVYMVGSRVFKVKEVDLVIGRLKDFWNLALKLSKKGLNVLRKK